MRTKRRGKKLGKNNKIACIHITRNDVRIVEGRVSSGVILISHSAIVQKAGRFFSGDRLANMSDLVSAIVTSMTMNSTVTRHLPKTSVLSSTKKNGANSSLRPRKVSYTRPRKLSVTWSTSSSVSSRNTAIRSVLWKPPKRRFFISER